MSAQKLPRGVTLILLSSSLVACSSWRVLNVAPAQLVQGQEPTRLRVTRQDGSQWVIDRPRLNTDSLLGESQRAPIAVPLNDIHALAVRKGDTGKTLALIGGLAGGLLFVGAVAMNDCCGVGVGLGGD